MWILSLIGALAAIGLALYLMWAEGEYPPRTIAALNARIPHRLGIVAMLIISALLFELAFQLYERVQ